MFGRRKQQDQHRGSTREAERRALFAELAKRPDTVCPLLGLAASRTEYHGEFTREHRCYAFGDPSELSAEQQEKVCLQRGYGNCPRYLRGVLVIPTEELEALRRSAAPVTPPAPPPAAPRPMSNAARGGGRRRGVIGALLAVILVGAGGGAAFLFLQDGGTAVAPTPTPSLTVSPSASAEPSITGSPPPPSPVQTPDPTPIPGDVFDFYEVAVVPGDYVLFEVDDTTGAVIRERGATFSANSQAPVELLLRPDGSRHWRTMIGEYTGLSYIHDASGPFGIRAVYKRPDGSRSSELLPEDEL